MTSYNELIYGKNQQERIISLEVVDTEDSSQIELYVQEEDGSVSTKIVPNKYWILSDKPVQKDWVRLKGNLHYQYGKQYNSRQDYQKFRSIFGKNNDIYSIWNPQESAMVKDGITLFKGMKVSDVSVLAFDIETPGFELDIYSKVLIIANTYKDHTGKITRKMFSYDEYENQGELLKAWCDWVREINPTVICGHNILTFDLPYMETVAELNGVTLDLGRDGSALKFDSRESKFRKEGSQMINYKKAKVFGRHIIDTFFLAIKYDVATRKYDSYGLKNIIKQEGLEVENRQHYDAALIKKNYKIPEEWEKIKRYAEFDGDDALKLYELMIPAYFYFSQSTPKTIQSVVESSTGAPLNAILVRSYLQKMHSIPKATELPEHTEGGISFAVPGIYRNLLKVDLKSAYPSQILRFEMYDKNKDPEANFYTMVKHFTYERFDLKDQYKKTKDRYYYDREQSNKIVINSAYGVTITNGLNFNSPELGAKITHETREVIDFALKWASGKDKQYWINLFEEKTGGKKDETA